jgi:hypothetical protein
LWKLLIAAALIIVVSRLVGAAFRHINQPQVVGEIVAGIMLGPSLLGAIWPAATDWLFSTEVLPFIDVMAQVGLIFFMFLIGLELDIRLIRGRGHAAGLVSHVSIIGPFLLGVGLALALFTELGSAEGTFTPFALFLGASMSITAFPVLARILTEKGLYKTRLGVVTLTCAAVDDVTAWCLLAVAPLHNGKIDAETQAKIKAGYPEIFARCQETFACFMHTPDPRGAFEVSDEEREANYERLYGERGFGIWVGNFNDILTDRKANATISDFVARKIRGRVKNQAVAEKLIPKNHGFGTRRLPLETFYYEVYNQDNVELVDIKETPIERITPDGIKTSEKEYEFDIIIYATGFDAITGSFDKIDFRGAGGARLKDKWKSGPETYLGIMVHEFPNMLMLMGPHTALGNIPRSIEYSVEWVTGLVRFAMKKGLTRLEATPEGVKSWTDHVKALGEGMLSNEVDSWMTGINSNVEGKQRRIVARYSGSAPAYRARCDEVAAKGYEELRLG